MKSEATQIEPLHEYVLVYQSGGLGERKTAGGIIKPDGAGRDDERYTVVAVGPGKMTMSGTRAPMPVKVGDVVLVQQGTTIYGTDDAGQNGLGLLSSERILAIDRRPAGAIVVPMLQLVPS